MRKENKLVKQMIIPINTYPRVRRLHRAHPITPFTYRVMHGCGGANNVLRIGHRCCGRVEGGYIRNIVRGGI